MPISIIAWDEQRQAEDDVKLQTELFSSTVLASITFYRALEMGMVGVEQLGVRQQETHNSICMHGDNAAAWYACR